MKLTRGILALSLLAVGVRVVGASAPSFQSVEIVPAAPTIVDNVHVVVHSGFGDRCWGVTSTDCAPVGKDTVLVTVATQHDTGGACPDQAWTYDRTCAFGLLPAGSYVAVFTELHDPLPSSTVTLVFTVTAPTPVVHMCWRALKARYR